MIKGLSTWALIWGFVLLVYGNSPVFAAESDKHVVMLDSVEVTAGKDFTVNVSVISGKIADDEESTQMGFGSFCIPLKYDPEAFKVDSVAFINTLEKWDEKFTNPKIDTGFVSLAGIFDMGGKDNPPVYTPDKPETIAQIHFKANKKAKKGVYKIELTRDPRQNNIYLGSPKGVVSVTPKYKPGIIVVK